MRIPSRGRGHVLQFNITPLIDVVFLLIIFFLVASYFIRHDTVDAVELPLATQGEEDEAANDRLVVTVDAAGNLTLAQQPLSLAEFSQRLSLLTAEAGFRAASVRIRADQKTEYQHVEPLLLAAAKAGITKIRFAVLPTAGELTK